MRNKEFKVFIPENVNIEQLITTETPNFTTYKNKPERHYDKLNYLLSLVYSIPANNKDLELKDNYTPINTELLREFGIRNKNEYFTFLIENNIIECNNSYKVNEYSKGYKVKEEFESKDLVPYKITDKKLVNKYYSQRINANSVDTYPHLFNFFNSSLTIDKKQAEQEAFKLADGNQSKLQSYLLNINFISNTDWKFKVDSTSGRLHTNITGMKSELRKFLSYNGKKLKSSDISNSHPYLFQILADPNALENPLIKKAFLGIKISDKQINKNSRQPTIKELKRLYYDIIMLAKNNASNADMVQYKELVNNGKFYSYLNERLAKPINDYKKLKKQVLVCINATKKVSENMEVGKIIKRDFPSVFRIMDTIKKRNYSILSVLLQSIEARIVLDLICDRISKERPMLCIYTIHDSILTTKGNEQYVKKVMEECFESIVGFKSTIHSD